MQTAEKHSDSQYILAPTINKISSQKSAILNQ